MTVTKLHAILRGQQVWLSTAIVFIIALLIAAFGYYEQQQLLGITRNTVQVSLPGLLIKQRMADKLDLFRYHGSVVAAFDVNLADRRRAMAAAQLIASHPLLADEPQLAALLDESVAVLARLTPNGSDRDVLQQRWTALSEQLGASARQIAGDSAVRLRRESEHVERVVAQSRIRWAATLVAMGALALLSLYLRQRHAALERTFRSLAENTPDGIMRFTPDARCTYINPVLERRYAVSLKDIVGKTPLQCHRSARFVSYQKSILEASSSGRDSEMEVSVRQPNGRVQHRRTRFVVERDHKGRVAGVIVIGTDFTHLKEAEGELRQSRDTLRTLMAHQEKNREAERKRTAWEVHEDLGQNLMALRMNLSMLEALADRRSGPMQTRLRLTQELTDRSIEIVRAVTTTLHPAVLDLGIVAALEWLAAEFIKQTGMVCELHLDGSDISMSEECVMAIFRIAEEALDNVTWHAEASRVEMTLERREHDYYLCITDDGTGFDLNATKEQCPGARERSQALNGHCGDCAQCYLLGVQERALALGGEATITSAPGAGTALKVRIPVDA